MPHGVGLSDINPYFNSWDDYGDNGKQSSAYNRMNLDNNSYDISIYSLLYEMFIIIIETMTQLKEVFRDIRAGEAKLQYEAYMDAAAKLMDQAWMVLVSGIVAGVVSICSAAIELYGLKKSIAELDNAVKNVDWNKYEIDPEYRKKVNGDINNKIENVESDLEALEHKLKNSNLDNADNSKAVYTKEQGADADVETQQSRRQDRNEDEETHQDPNVVEIELLDDIDHREIDSQKVDNEKLPSKNEDDGNSDNPLSNDEDQDVIKLEINVNDDDVEVTIGPPKNKGDKKSDAKEIKVQEPKSNDPSEANQPENQSQSSDSSSSHNQNNNGDEDGNSSENNSDNQEQTDPSEPESVDGNPKKRGDQIGGGPEDQLERRLEDKIFNHNRNVYERTQINTQIYRSYGQIGNGIGQIGAAIPQGIGKMAESKSDEYKALAVLYGEEREEANDLMEDAGAAKSTIIQIWMNIESSRHNSVINTI